MSWADGIFGHPPDKSKILLCAKLAQAAYKGDYSYYYPLVSNVRKLTDLDPPGVYIMDVGGDEVVVLPGTTAIAEISAQDTGWDAPTNFGGGVINSYHYLLARNIFSACPFGVKLFTGHSMGGALAMICARLAKDANLPVRGALSFASPRIVDLDALVGPWPSIINVVNAGDTVPEFPGISKNVVQYDWYTPGEQYLATWSGLTLVSQTPPSIVGVLASFIKDVLFSGHSISTYIKLLESAISSPALTGGNMLETYRVMWQAVLFGQSVQNILHYRISDTNTALDIATEIRRLWRLYIKPMTSASLRVLYYDVAKISGTVSNGKSPPANLFRYNEKARLAGTDLDVGDDSGDCFPSYVAAGANKSVGPWFVGGSGAASLAAGQFKLTRGSIRLSGVDEDRNDASDNNRLKIGDVTNYQNAFNGLMKVLPGSGNPSAGNMCVVTTSIEGIPIVTGTPPVTGYYFAYVDSLTVNPFLTTQNSRKASISRLG